MPNAAQITLTGHVQGVGFRPFVYRLAHQHKLTGYVQNRLGEVDIIACGAQDALQHFRQALIEEAPPLAAPKITHAELVDSDSFEGFSIVPSASDADARIFVPADHFMCDDCKRELNDPADRRYRYPFINCTQCGPRYTLIQSLPYDRENTSMANFELCDDCRSEYEDPMDRRFHAEPIACGVCGPGLNFEKGGHLEYSDPDSELALAVAELKKGGIVAVKGIGGYHLMCDAHNQVAVDKLRLRKHRPDKPLAVMFPMRGDDGLDHIRKFVRISADEADRLLSPSRPILLLRKHGENQLAINVAPHLNEIGVFLPYSPLHELLLNDFGGPLVATSGNISGEPVLTDNDEALSRLANIADAFLHHDRPIVRPADDPVCRKIAGEIRPFRMGRGSAPCELELPWSVTKPLLAVGGHMKGTLALAWDNRAVVSPHIGEMENARSFDVFEQLVQDLQALYAVQIERIVSDAHPGYTTHRWARRYGLPVSNVFHHQAHASALAAEIAGDANWLMFTWDGVGYGEDGSLWGGEALFGRPGAWNRFASFRPFRLPGGNLSGRAPWRSAAALHWENGETWNPESDTDGLAQAAWRNNLNSPASSAAGRLFDAAAAIICDQPNVSYEAQGPMQLESLCRDSQKAVRLPLRAESDGVFRSDWAPLLAMLKDESLSASLRAEIFHSSLATVVLDQAQLARSAFDVDCIGLTGGVFQNRFLTSLTYDLLTTNGFDVQLPLQLPCNDAALSFGQVAEVAARESRRQRNG